MTSHSLKMLGSSSHTEDEREQHDYYATDPQAVRDFLAAYVDRDVEYINPLIWEPSCGEGNISKVLEEGEYFYHVLSSDLIDREYGVQLDFLKPTQAKWSGDILTNPPYKYAIEFIQSALSRIKRGSRVIMLLRLQFLEGIKRGEFYRQHPPKFVYVHSKRIGIWKNNEPTGANAVAYAWFVWEKGYQGDPALRWIDAQ